MAEPFQIGGVPYSGPTSGYGVDYSQGTTFGPEGAPSLGAPASGGFFSGLMNDPSKMAAMGGVASKGLSAANRIIGTLLMIRQMEKQRDEEKRQFNMEKSLSEKSMMLDYLLGNKNYRDKLSMLNTKLGASKRKRSTSMADQEGYLGTSQSTR